MRFLRAFLFIFAAILCVFSVSADAQNDRKYLLVLNKGGASLTILDPTDLKVLGTVPVGDSPHEVVASADGKTAVVANYGAQTPGNTLSVIDLASRTELRRVELLPLMRPHGIIELGGKIYFTAETNRAIARFDLTSGKVDWLMGTGQNASHMVVGTADQKRFYTANIASDSVTMFEFANVPPAGSQITHIPVGKQPEAIDLSPDGKEVWVGLNQEGAIDIVDTTTKKVSGRIALGERPYRVRFAPDGKKAYATMPNTKEIIVIDSAGRKELNRIKLDSVPLGIAFSKDGKHAFVTIVQTDGVLKIDLEKSAVIARAEAGQAPDGIALAGM